MVSSIELIADQIKARVIAELEKPDVSKASLARAANLHENTLRAAGTPDWKPSIETLRLLEGYLNAPDRRAA